MKCNLPNIDCVSQNVKGLNGVEFVECVQGISLKQYIDDPTMERAKLDLEIGQDK